MDPPLADVVSFAERARVRRPDEARGGEDAAAVDERDGDNLDGATGDGSPPSEGAQPAAIGPDQPADLAREAMFRRFGQLVRGDPPGSLRSVDDELAVLVYDSASETEQLVGIRGQLSEVTRQLTFRGPSLVIEVQMDDSGGEMTCQVVPPQPASLEVRHSSGSLHLGTDEFGTFFAPNLPAGTISLRCVPVAGDTGPTATSWISVSDRPLA